ncbi:MAG: MaoC family dehydratase N-terminal domain-containing protein [Chloroflexi bacterium]|nr:MaoC family dehydratase N-terminal domain-containing protein [Chloroflexota bacterium]
MDGKYWDDVKVGHMFSTQGRTVTETDLVNFVGLSGLWEPLFLDREFVTKQSIFGKPIIPGPLTFVMSLGLEALTGFAHGTGMAFLGLDEVRAMRPVFVNDTIHVDVEVIEKHETSKPDRGVMVIKYTTKNQNGEPVLTCKLTRMVRRHQA